MSTHTMFLTTWRLFLKIAPILITKVHYPNTQIKPQHYVFQSHSVSNCPLLVTHFWNLARGNQLDSKSWYKLRLYETELKTKKRVKSRFYTLWDCMRQSLGGERGLWTLTPKYVISNDLRLSLAKGVTNRKPSLKVGGLDSLLVSLWTTQI